MSDLVTEYRLMRSIRALEDASLALSREGLFTGSVHPSNGHEAVPAGFASVLQPQDKIVATYRGHGWALASGISFEQVLAEICQRSGGVNGGRAGSLMINSIEHGFIGENSIVGAGVPIAGGVAMAERSKATGAVTVCAFGDGAMSQGALHEGFVFAAAMNLPVVFVCENNGWAEMTPTSAVSRHAELRKRAEGYGIPARTVDGCDVREVLDAATWALEEARSGRGPVFLEFNVVRLKGHYNKDIEHYRPAADIEAARLRDPLEILAKVLRDGGQGEVLASVDAEVDAEAARAVASIREMPHPDPAKAQDHLYAPDAVTSWAPRGEIDSGVDMSYWKAVNTALRTEMEQRSEVLVYGEDVGFAGGIFGLTRGLQKTFGADRVFDTPIAESAILGSAVGAATQGLRPVVEIMWMDFLMVALDQLVNQAANVRYASQGTQTAPLTVRVQQGATAGSCAQHTQSLEALLAHIPGLRVGLPATPGDAYAMTRAAIADPDPVVLIEARDLYQSQGLVDESAAIEPIGGARLYGEEFDVAIISWGTMVPKSLEARDRLATLGIRAGVLDLRWLAPLDVPAILSAVRAADGRAVVVHEANLTGGFGGEIVSTIVHELQGDLSLWLTRVGTSDTRIPTPGAMQEAVIPGVDTIVRACEEAMRSRVVTTRG